MVMQNLGQGLGPIIVVATLVVAILWIALPFAVFGIKKRLDAILAELKRLNRSS